MTTINMQVGQSYTFDLNTTVPAIPVEVSASVSASIPTAVQITMDGPHKGAVKALTPSGGVIVTYSVPGYTAATDMLVIVNPPPPPLVIVVRGPVG